MLSFHSIAPVRLTQATEKRPPPKPKPPAVMTDTQVASHSAVPQGIDAKGPAQVKDLKTEREPGAVVPEGQRDSGIDLSHDEVNHDATVHDDPPISTLDSLEETSHVMADAQEAPQQASQPVISSQEVAAPADENTEAGPSRAQESSSNPPPRDNAVIRPVPHRGESTVNAVGYRRDSETVIAFLVPLPKPTIQGSTLDIPPKYFLYVPPPPHLVKPNKGKEPYARRAHRVWQQNVRKAKANAHNGKRVSFSALHSATIRGCIWASERRKGSDDGAIFLGRIEAETVAHLVMIHPWALSADQTPEEILKTFRAQITATKASSIVKIINRKMGPEPKTLQISPRAIIDGTRGPRGSESSEEDDDEEVVVGVTENEQPRASRMEKVRASFDSAKLRNPVAAIKNQIQQRGRKRHRDGSPSADTPEAAAESAEPSADLTEGELEHYSEEEETHEGGAAGLVNAEGEPFTGHQLGEIPEEGFLEHFEEETVEETPEAAQGTSDQAGGGLFAGSTDGANGSDSQAAKHAKKGSRFQLTFYPSPAMDIMSRYVQESCHVANGHAFPNPTAVPTAAGVLASIGWEPERRVFASADEQLEDEHWQARETEEDLALITAKAARAWERQCRKHVTQSKGGRLGDEKKPGKFAILVARVQPRKSTKAAKGKTKEGQPEEQPSDKNGKASPLKQRVAAIRAKRSKKQKPTQETDPAEEKNGKAAALKKRFAAMKEKRGKKKQATQETDSTSEKKGKATALKQRLAAIRDKRTKKQQTTQETDQTDPAEKQSKKEKAQKAAGIILFPVILILGIPVLIGKGIASGFKKVKDRKNKNKTEGEGEAEGTEQQQQQEAKAKTSRRAAVKHRLSERSGSVKQGLSTRGEAIKKRLAERKAKKADASGATHAAAATAESPEGQAGAAGEDAAAVGDMAAQARLTKKQRLASLLAAGPLAVNAMISKRRQGKDKPTTTPADSEDATPTDKKASRFAGSKERVKALRTKVNKQARFAKIKARLRTLQERRQNKKNVKKTATATTDNNTTQAPEADDSNDTSNVKKHSAIAGLAAACVALPAAKMKQVRDKRRRDKAAEGVEGAAAAAREERATANNTAAAGATEERESASPASRPSGVRLVPSEPGMLEPAEDPFRPPENGQSEVPVQQAARTEPDLLPESESTAGAGANAPAAEEDHATRPAAAVRFKSIRDGFDNVKGGIGSGITNLKARRRGTGQDEVPVAEDAERPPPETMDSAETRVEANPSTVEPTPQTSPAQQDTAASGGRFKSIKDGIGSGIEGLKAKRQREKETPQQGEESATTAAAEEEKRTAGANKYAQKYGPTPGERLKALKDGIGSRMAKTGENGADAPVKTEKSKQQKQQTHKDLNSGLVDRVRWFLYAA